MSEPINFVETKWTYLSPFSAHEVVVDDIVYKTAEHAYQALRMKPEARAEIIDSPSPLEAWRRAQTSKENNQIDESVDKLELMEKIFRAKLKQHKDVRDILESTATQELLKVYDTDYYWGTGADGSGENQMGKLWMKLRAELE
ncbi:NADAR family protein [Patescibacteria group bacterium]|nr:NADAR family protein [Patescibacteria group bacterium]